MALAIVSGHMTTLTLTVDTSAKGRNGDDRAWEYAKEATYSANWGQAIEALRTMNTFFQAHACDTLFTISDLKCAGMPVPTGRLGDMFDAQVREWNRAVMATFGM